MFSKTSHNQYNTNKKICQVIAPFVLKKHNGDITFFIGKPITIQIGNGLF
jgi:hypothetical protein